MLDTIEKELGIFYPNLYHQLFDDGMLNWGRGGPKWYQDEYPKLRHFPPFLLFANDFQIIEVSQILNTAKKIQTCSEIIHALVPFGKNGAGDIFCIIYTNMASISGIGQLNKYTGEMIILAKSFEDFLFWELASAVSDMNTEDLEDLHSISGDLDAMLQSHSKYLSNDRANKLGAIYKRPIIEFEDGETGKILDQELWELLGNEINFTDLGKKIQF